MGDRHGFKTPVARHYIDVRPYVRNPHSVQARQLPLLDTLPKSVQDAVLRYVRAPDRFMSLASALLKWQFIHRNAKIPWSQVEISRTPKPHARPYWSPPSNWHGDSFEGLEFNCSHQAGLVVLMGCRTPDRPRLASIPSSVSSSAASSAAASAASSSAGSDYDSDSSDEFYVDPSPEGHNYGVRVGIDVACTHESKRSPDLSTQTRLNEWVDTFGEMFSQDEREDMKSDPSPADLRGAYGTNIVWNWNSDRMGEKARRFYTCWALKEAYIKMVGEGLLADWLRELEFAHVIPPEKGQRFSAQDAGMQVLFEGEEITESMETQLEGFEDNFILASMTRGIDEDTSETGAAWRKLDIERDIRPCAEGRCTCLRRASAPI